VEEEEEKRYYVAPEIVEKLLDPSTFLEQIELYLRGYVVKKEPDGSLKLKKAGPPLLNPEGIQEIMKLMRMRLGEVYRHSDLDMEYIREETFFFNCNLAELLSIKGTDWKLKREFYQELIDYLVSSFEAILRMSLGARTLMNIFGIPMKKEEKPKFWIFG
jgi:hypothetical protein